MILVEVIVCLVFAGFFAGMETGLIACNRNLSQEQAGKGVLHARSTEFLLAKPERLLGTTLIGHNIANVTAAVIVTNHFERLGLEHYTWIAIVAMTFVFLIFDDFIPKSFLNRHADTVAVRLSPLLVAFYVLFLPIYVVLNSLVKAVLVFTGKHKATREELKTKRDLRFLVNISGKEAGLPEEDQRIIEDILHFRDQLAREVMIPFHKLPVLTISQSLEDAVTTSIDSGVRFLPVSEHRTDNMIGYIDTNDLITTDTKSIHDVLRSATYFPETRRIPDLLLAMNLQSLEVVFLVDEYGAISGMITPNQIVADVVHYTPEEGARDDEIQPTGPGHYLVDAETDIEDLCHELGIMLGKTVNSTIGGYVCERLGVIPKKGAEYRESGYTFTVIEGDARHISRIEVGRIPTESAHGKNGDSVEPSRR